MPPSDRKTPNPRMAGKARRLRRDSTFRERELWSILRNQRFGGWKFRRQHPIDPFVADVCCVEARLVVEVDGMSHVGTGDRDDRRSAYFERQGYRVVRVTNDDVLEHIEAVAEMILRELGGPKPIDGGQSLSPRERVAGASRPGEGGPENNPSALSSTALDQEPRIHPAPPSPQPSPGRGEDAAGRGGKR